MSLHVQSDQTFCVRLEIRVLVIVDVTVSMQCLWWEKALNVSPTVMWESWPMPPNLFFFYETCSFPAQNNTLFGQVQRVFGLLRIFEKHVMHPIAISESSHLTLSSSAVGDALFQYSANSFSARIYIHNLWLILTHVKYLSFDYKETQISAGLWCFRNSLVYGKSVFMFWRNIFTIFEAMMYHWLTELEFSVFSR